MAKISRITYKVFGSSGDVNSFGQFGSLAAGSPLHTKDLTLIQALGAYLDGLSASTGGGSSPPALEDENGIKYLNSSMIAYLFQQGIAEWDSGTTYYLNSYVSSGTFIYRSLQDNNLGHAVSEPNYWIKILEIITTEPTANSTDNQLISAKRVWTMFGAALSTLTTTAKTIVGAINELVSGKQNTLNRTVGGNDNATGTISDTGGNLSVPVPLTTVAPSGSSTQTIASTSSLRAKFKVLVDNIAYLFTNKQDKLTAGENITISNNVISATGGGEEGFPMNITVTATATNKTLRLSLKTTNLVYPMSATYHINWGDGNQQDVTIDANSTGLITHTYSSTGTYTVNIGKPTYQANLNQQIYGVIIDESNSNPETSVTYTDQAVGMQPANVSAAAKAAWDATSIFNQIKPCMFKNGTVNYYLNPTDFSKKADGTTADISSGNDGDVMIEIPKLGLSISKDGNAVSVKLTNAVADPNFHYYAHTRYNEGDREKLYIGAYKAYVTDSKLYSLSSKTPTVNTTLNNFRTYAHNKGTGYDQISFYARTLLQAFFFLRYKNLNSQVALGQGYCGGSSAQTTGATNQSGMDYGSTGTTSRVKFLGVEDCWGNIWEFLDGIYISSNVVSTAFSSYNDGGSGYANRGTVIPSGYSTTYFAKVAGTSESGFVPTAASGSASTYYSDGAWTGSTTPLAGGSWDDGSAAGVLCWVSNYGSSFSFSSFGARLMFL
ncbi:phage-related protein [Candidatus Termititenax aidoneus]|uniref:Phage-related protein n=1 Tax=Termititenax aidoneus TaxID=2218524 RepID=A0A388TCF2_TERA1|nr:phage-related protein [Candidatus Termititenax aidoneus]